MEKQQTRELKKRGVYLLPNLLTTGGLFAGFYAIVAGVKGHFDTASIAIFVAMIADSLDGRVARLMKAHSSFGMEYDSLSDMVSFGIAPSLVIYSCVLHNLGKIGWLVAFLFTASVALRLARFNVQVDNQDKRFFKGLPSPAGAGTIAAFVWLLSDKLPLHAIFSVLAAILTFIIAALMVSNIRYRSFKELDFKGRMPFFSILIVILIFVAISIDPPSILFIIFSSYILSGPVITLFRVRQLTARRKMRKLNRIQKQ